jgi:hypothetical protein
MLCAWKRMGADLLTSCCSVLVTLLLLLLLLLLVLQSALRLCAGASVNGSKQSGNRAASGDRHVSGIVDSLWSAGYACVSMLWYGCITINIASADDWQQQLSLYESAPKMLLQATATYPPHACCSFHMF